MSNSTFQQEQEPFSIKAIRMQREIMPKNVRVLRGEKQRTKPSILEDERIIVHLAKAFMIGATQTEAAQFAGCSRSALKKHLHGGTLIEYETETNSEARVSTFADLVTLWKSHLTLLCKMVIYADIVNPNTDTKSAWKLLDKVEGRKRCNSV